MTDPRELLSLYFEGRLTPEEMEALQAALRSDPELVRRLASTARDEILLHRHYRKMAPARQPRVRPKRRRGLLVAAAAFVLVGLAVWLFLPRESDPVAVLVREPGEVRTALRSGDVVEGAARIEFPGEATTVRVEPGARIRLGDFSQGKRLDVRRGTVRAVVARQPAGRPFLFSTPHGRAEVLGTTLAIKVVSEGAGSTRLEVVEGKVRLTSSAGQSVNVLSGHYAVAAAGVELVARPVVAAEWVRSMPPNSWRAAPGTRMKQVVPDPVKYPKIQLVSGARSVVSSWSGGALDTQRNKLIVWGGGASSYAGNELYAFRLDDLAWELLTPPTAEPSLGEHLNAVDGTPVGRSTYNGLAYIAHADRFFALGGAIAVNRGNVGSDITWTFDFSSRRWTNMKPSGTLPRTLAGNLCAYDPATRKVWWFDGAFSGVNGLFSYDFNANRWTKHNEDLVVDATCTVDTKRGLLLVVGRGEVLAYDLRDPKVPRQVWKTRGGDEFVAKPRPGLDYHPGADRIVGWFGGPVYALDPETKVWTVHDAPGAPAPTETGIYGRWRYVPSLDAFVVVTDYDVDVHFFKLGPK